MEKSIFASSLFWSMVMFHSIQLQSLAVLCLAVSSSVVQSGAHTWPLGTTANASSAGFQYGGQNGTTKQFSMGNQLPFGTSTPSQCLDLFQPEC